MIRFSVCPREEGIVTFLARRSGSMAVPGMRVGPSGPLDMDLRKGESAV